MKNQVKQSSRTRWSQTKCFQNLCATALWNVIFLISISHCTIPMIWKTYCIVPVPKKQPVKVMNDLRPVAFTSCVMKMFERVVHVHLQEHVADFMGPFQFVYRKNRSIDDAILQVLNSIYSHLEMVRKTVNHACPGIHHNVDFRLSYKPSTVCQSAVRTQILQSPATSCYRTELYIGRHLHQHGSATGDRFVAIFVFSVYGR